MISLNKARGVVLVVALVLILPITLIAVAVMQWAREDSKITGVTSNRVVSEQQVIGTLLSATQVAGLSTTILSMPAAGFAATVNVAVAGGGTVSLSLRAPQGVCTYSDDDQNSGLTSCRYVNGSAVNAAIGKSGIGQVRYFMGLRQGFLN
jgi:type IV pilus assembly protein PilX